MNYLKICTEDKCLPKSCSQLRYHDIIKIFLVQLVTYMEEKQLVWAATENKTYTKPPQPLPAKTKT